MKFRNVLVMLLGVSVVVVLAACTKKKEAESDGGGFAQIANPWTDCKDLKEAAKMAKFSFEVPESIGERKIVLIQNMSDKMIQVFYAVDDEDTGKILLRKAPGSEDISGDYNEYAEKNEVKIDSLTVTEQGNDGKVSLVTWCSDGYSYAVSVSDMSADEVAEIVKQMK